MLVVSGKNKNIKEMNWLAHLFLSEPNVESRLGNILADVVKGSARQELNHAIQRGIKCHHAIDTFTDSHSIVKRSKQLISSDYRHMKSVLVDVFYDHFLAKNWSKYSNIPLDQFIKQIYESFQAYPGNLPPIFREIIIRIASEDWLGAYRNISGVENTLSRISKKLSVRRNRSFMLERAVSELIIYYDEFDRDFQEFFPELLQYVRDWSLT
jgi:acyl carrier protein phosphodiesterase